MKSAKRSIAFVTCEKFPQFASDDRVALPALEARGFEVVPAIWDDPRVDWSSFEAVILRSTWDYYLRFEAFGKWLAGLEARGVRVLNDVRTIRWNSRKTYLRELAARDVPVVPTFWPGERASWEAWLSEWSAASEFVIKPIVSAAGHQTLRLSRDELREGGEARALIESGRFMVQPFLPEIVSQGEWSFLFFAGQFSHCLVKRAAPGEFRVQLEHGGSVHRPEPEPWLLAAARNAFAAVPFPSLYARVDGVVADGRFQLMELELIEPTLYFGMDAGAPARFADALETRLKESLS